MDDLRYQVDMLTAKNNRLEADEKIYKLICNTSNNVYIYFCPITGEISTFGNWGDFFDFPLNEFSDLTRILEILDEEYVETVRDCFYLENNFEKEKTCVVKLKDKNKFAEIRFVCVYDESGKVSEKLISFSDVTKKENLNKELTYMAYYDFMTGLLNRNYFIQQLNNMIIRAEKEKVIVSILMIDIDDFHKINDGMGILYGDEVVQDFGMFLNTLVDEDIIGARFDGDIYAMAIYNPFGSKSLNYIIKSIQTRLKTPFRLTNSSDVSFTVSIGVAEYPEAGNGGLELVNSAEIVMLQAKDSGKNTIKYFDSYVLEKFKNSILIENKLKLAVNNMNFYLNFQPQFDTKTQRLRGFEALIRWKDEEGKLISPGIFIPVAEKNGSILSIGDWVLENSIKKHVEWSKKFDMEFIMSVNISSIQYKQGEFVNKVISLLNKYGMKPDFLELEITESVLIDDMDKVFDKMEELRDFGVKISIDDFGTGFSSLSYLKNLPADTIKIDKSFIDTLLIDNSTKIITKSIIDMAEKLGFDTIAEGVETKEQMDYLLENNCRNIQGYYLGKPLDCEKVEELFLRNL